MSAMMSQQTWREVAKVSPGNIVGGREFKVDMFSRLGIDPSNKGVHRSVGLATSQQTKKSFWRPCVDENEIYNLTFTWPSKQDCPFFSRCPLKSQTRSISKKRESRP